ncbi:50S ribosomal protein L29 [Candidatus Uhrbacteria bacterium CG10_big_fil_rev_8_21_14_0_10_50_16]|uniref:Large ribosomal subunit protein uL29 n=1 Tax=Candidatus Uhrbacteria bacterium CG10_big_fil_rev_8_21_14_0_10_50_16 TaxID=1975039 RepID=A0A2H0RM88_9BACT|nr:MAG: 50S ribosomal protein L29 [Candidatus Uhrbacteria bacterium CG10_big_fil_rev_8_21_14_0_10_50_16]
MEYKDLAKKSVTDLQTLLAEKRESLRELRFRVAANQLKQVHLIRAVRTEIAQIMTRVREIKNKEV